LGAEYDMYRVDSVDEILGNEHPVSKIRAFCRDVEKGIRRTPLIVYGPSGIGKTAAVHLLAREFGWNIVELNASDYRDKEMIEERLLSAATSRSLFGKRNLILLDEIDELASGFDKGAGAAISNLVSVSRNPIIAIANDMWDQSISFLRGKVDPIEFRRVPADTVQRALMNLCRKRNLKINQSAIEIISNRANGDVRSAINDMSAIIGTGEEEELTDVIGLRDRKTDIFNTLDRIFMTNTISSSMRAAMNTDLNNDMLIKWIDENIPKKYRSSGEMMRAFDSLALASLFASRATRSQYYTYWRYMNVLMSGGVALSKTHYPSSGIGYSFPKVIKELSMSKGSRGQEREIAEKLQHSFHSSTRKIIREEMRMIARIALKSIRDKRMSEEEVRDELANYYALEAKEIDYMLQINS